VQYTAICRPMRMVPPAAVAAYRSARKLYRRIRRRAVFEQIYRDNLWGDSESRSGSGSSLASTEKIRKGLLDAIERLKVRTVIDAPCGDFYWLSQLDLGRYLTSYVGFDIVPRLIKQNRETWGTEKISFEEADLIKQPLPSADLILCRHLLIHLPFEDCIQLLRNFRSSGSRYLMITNSPHVEQNEEIIYTGSFRPLNLYLAPFHFPQAILTVDDSIGTDRTEAAVFQLSTLEI
jgi:Methyltransferase domain